ncbi:lysozyme inhibitor LprI family protein [Burkholderia gladioli]|uniref:lysozyme inhibitor LprI family protein n=1 Tax=Burkholderia gladioli TaxID=28095 RepID=UPI00163FA562|nr:lysozyme inhibitor LprI family protein [Burkholderia gladioli]
MKKRKIFHLVAAFALILVTTNILGAPLPAILTGKWQVKEVHLNTESGRTTEYAWNDPRLRGRIFEFTPDEVSDDADDFPGRCAEPTAHDIDASLRDLMLRSLGGYAYPAPADVDPVSDYKLESAEGMHIRAFTLMCTTGRWQSDLGRSDNTGNSADNKNKGIPGAWIALADDQKMYLRWRDEVMLVLMKIPSNAPIQASFPCLKASTSTEHAICGSYQLAAFDQSIAESYRRAVNQAKASGSPMASLIQDQRLWVKDRDACGANVECLLGSMRRRLAALAAGSNGS